MIDREHLVAKAQEQDAEAARQRARIPRHIDRMDRAWIEKRVSVARGKAEAYRELANEA